MQPRLLLVQDDRAFNPVVLDLILRKNVDLYVICGMDGCGGGLPSDRVIVADSSDLEALQAATRQFGVEFDAVGTLAEARVVRSAQLAAALKLPGPPVGAVACSSADKPAMRAALAAGGVSTPHYRVLHELTSTALHDALQAFGTIVIKPSAGEDSIGVRKVMPGDDLDNTVLPALRASIGSAHRTLVNLDTMRWVVEQYIGGDMLSVDGFVINGVPVIVGLVENELGPEPHFIMRANWLPSRLSRASERACHYQALKAVQTLGFNHCAFHCELRIGADGPVVIEIAARLPGGQLPAAYHRALGIDLIGAQVDLWLGRKPDLTPKSRIQIHQKGVFPASPGIVKSADGFDRAAALQGVWQFTGLAQAGEPAISHPATPVPYYYFAVEGPGPDEVAALADYVESLVEVQLV